MINKSTVVLKVDMPYVYTLDNYMMVGWIISNKYEIVTCEMFHSSELPDCWRYTLKELSDK